MRSTELARSLARFLLLLCFALTATRAAAPHEVYLCADETSVTVPDGSGTVTIPMWGFAEDDDNDLSNGCGNAATVPGPAITVPVDDTDLVIHLRNNLDGSGTAALPKATSVVIPGLEMPVSPSCSSPVWTDGTTGPRNPDADPMQRVRSFGCEADPGGGMRDYRWTSADGNPVAPGTYPYHSGTHPQVQVQMGLYGEVHRDFADGEAYDSTASNDTTFDEERGLLFSEIDPALHAAVNSGDYGDTGPTSTLAYQPRYFLINGQPFDPSAPDCIPGPFTAGDRIRLRLVNSGLRQLAPMLLSSHWDVVAEGGKALPFSHRQYQVLLMPGSSNDVIFTPTHGGRFWIIERGLSLTNSSATKGGMQACLDVAAAPPNLAPTADPGGPYAGTAGIPIAFDGTGSSDPEGQPLSYSWDFGDGSTGTGATPTHTYASHSGSPYTVTLTVNDGTQDSLDPDPTTTVTVEANDPPTAVGGGPYTGKTGFPVSFDGTGSSDPESQSLSYSWTFGDSSGDSGATPSHTYATPGVKTVILTVNDGFQDSAPDETTATITDNTPPVAVLPPPFSSPDPTVTLDGCGSSDADLGDSLSYSWNFGDGESTTTSDPACSVVHTYATAGTFTVTLSVSDGYEDSTAASTQVTIGGTAPNVAPVANPDAFNPNEGSPATIAAPGVLANDVDPDGPSALTAQLATASPLLKNLVLSPDGGFSYSPGEKVGVFPFTYQTFDGIDRSLAAHVDVTREIWVKKVVFKRIAVGPGSPGQWRIEGRAYLPTGSLVTVYVGPTTEGTCIATAAVSPTGVWKLQKTVGTAATGCPGGALVPPLGTATGISADHTASVTGCPTAPVCGAVFNVPIKVD